MPSMFIPDGIVERVKEVCAHPLVGEFILMDNTVEGGNIKEEIPKLTYIEEGQNTFINPAWNKGAAMAKYDKLMFLNDDIITDFTIIDKIYDHITEDKGIIGLGEGCWKYNGGEFGVRPIHEFRGGFACLFFIHKNVDIVSSVIVVGNAITIFEKFRFCKTLTFLKKKKYGKNKTMSWLQEKNFFSNECQNIKK